MRWGVGLPVGIRRKVSGPSARVRFARAMDRLITRAQERLEKKDGKGWKMVVFTALAIGFVYILVEVVSAWLVSS